MRAHTTRGDDGYILYKASEWEVCWKAPHSYMMHNPQQERCTVLPWKGVRRKRSADGEWKSSSVNIDHAVHEDFSFLPYPKVKGEGRRWKTGPETHVFNTLVYFIEVRDRDKVSEPPSSLTLWNWNLQRSKREGHFFKNHCQITAANHCYFLL